MTHAEMAKYLRCTCTVKRDCDENCPYLTREVITPDYNVRPDIVIDGVGYWEGCDFEQAARDAAEMLENIPD